MKRLIFVCCAVMLAAVPAAALAMGKPTAPVDVNALVGMTEPDLTTKYGSPNRVEPSEYGFSWYVYNKDLRNFFMAGVRDGSVVAVYSNARNLSYSGKFTLGSSKSAVRSKMGKAVSYVRSGNTICVLSSADQRDLFAAGDKYVYVFYDNVSGGGVTSVMIVPQQDEVSALVNHPALSDSLVAAYQSITVDLVNSIRVRNGLGALSTDGMDAKLALARSADMRDRNYFDHYTPAPNSKSPFDQAKGMGIQYSSMGENISFGDHNAILAHEAFMNSSGHRYNIMQSSYTKIGTGAAYGGRRYVLLTEEFTG